MRKDTHRATTIKLPPSILKSIAVVKPSDMPLTTYVRKVLEREVARKTLEKSGKAYARFLENHPKESEWLSDWESAE